MSPFWKFVYDLLLYFELALAIGTGALYIRFALRAPQPFRGLKLMLGFDLLVAAGVLIQLSVGAPSAFESFQVRVAYILLLVTLLANAVVGRRRYDS